MKLLRRLTLAAAVLVGTGTFTPCYTQADDAVIQAGCAACGSHGGYSVPVMQPVPMTMPMMSPMMMRPGFGMMARSNAPAPPPGTLGTTYRRYSKPVPLDKHPRTAMIEVRNAGAMEVVVEGLEKFKGFRGDDGIWRFETDKPLIPGLPHIYTIKIGTPDAYGKTDHYQQYKIRVIPGRIVYF